ncbi:hypothetical protein [Endozoicomonas sp. ONNA2]|uniref:hypothetical protein n=1 Tax=Endozoicomonas sp. ONNA2 TaxID=2828741 RepID=UPI002147BDFD|nr:hypothetical protein [Endozoicomonas sp. ONNA2]
MNASVSIMQNIPSPNGLNKGKDRKKTTSDIPEKINQLSQVLEQQGNPKDADTQELLNGINDIITRTVDLMSDDKKPSFSFTQDERDMLCNTMLNAILKTSANTHAEIFHHLVPELVKSIEQVMTMLPSPEN